MTRKRMKDGGRVANSLVDTLMERIDRSIKRAHRGQVTYVIGNNGTGKSRILGELAERLRIEQPTRTVACIANSVHDRFKYGDEGRVRYLGARNATNAVFQAAVGRQMCRFILQAMNYDRRLYKQLSGAVKMDFKFTLGDGVAGQVTKSLESPAGTKRNLRRVRTHKDLLAAKSLAMLNRISVGTGRFEDLTTAQISIFLRYLDLNIDVSLNIALSDGTYIGFGELSTGEQNRTLLFAKVLSAIKEGSIFLIDEPEISLHLHWQMEFHTTLMELLSGIGRFHVVVATHAPIIISEAAKSDSNNAYNLVAVLRRELEDGQITGNVGPGTGSVTNQTHSFAEVASHEQLILRYFQSAPYHAREVSVEIAETVLSVAEGQTNKREAKKLLRELQTVVGLSEEAMSQINAAIELVERDLVTSIVGT